MNIYRTGFNAECPVNGDVIRYTLKIETNEVIKAEELRESVKAMGKKLHETIADELADLFPGKQTIVAEHGGVLIETVRE